MTGMHGHYATHSILIIDDELAVLKSLSLFLEECGYNVFEATSGSEGLDIFRLKRPDLVFTDLRMPEMDGLDVIRTLKELSPDTPVIVVSGIGVVADAVMAVKLGAWDYITKPIQSLTELEIVVKRALDTIELRHEVSALREQILAGELFNQQAFGGVITRDGGMLRIFQYVEAISPTNQPVLITGQTGTGKELIARALHDVSGRKGGFIAVNVGGVDDLMFSDSLFGHIKGAFTGADRVREGIIAQAAGGTLFLDEIGELADASQVKLLRLLQEQEYFPLGADTPRKSSARIVAATNRDLRALVDAGSFRQDLYYRLCTHQVSIPPLAMRKGDIPLLLDAFIQEAADTMKKKRPTVSPELTLYLSSYDFPGNVRELKSMVYDALARHSHGVLGKEYFLQAMGNRRSALPAAASVDETIRALGGVEERMPTLKEAEEVLINSALERAGGNQGVAARYLGITRQGLNKILNRKKLISSN